VKPLLVRFAIGIVIALFCIGPAARIYQVGLIAQLDNIIYDARMRLTMPRGVDERIVILDIDERSLQEVARWPWPRDVMARIIETLFDKYQVALVGFDVVFAEADYSSGIRSLDALAEADLKAVPGFREAYQRLRPTLDNDGLFAEAIKGRPVVLGYYLSSEHNAKRIASIPRPVLPKGTFAGRNIGFTTWEGYGGNLAPFTANAANAGHFNPVVDFDGVVRRVPMIAQLDDAYYEALSLAMVRAILGYPKVEAGFASQGLLQRGYAGLEWLKAGPLTIPVDETASALVPYRGPKGSFPYISLADVVAGRVAPEQLNGRVALVGTTAPGLLDLRSTPVGNVYPGVEIHANLIAGMLDRLGVTLTGQPHRPAYIPEKPAYMLGAEVVMLGAVGVALALAIPLLSALWATAASLAGLLLVAGLSLGVWLQASMVLPLAASLLMIAALYTINMAYGYFIESRSKRQFTELFGQYVPPELVDKMAEDPEQYSMEGKSEDLTVLFSDIVGFTSISESLEPRELALFINEYLTSMSLVIREHGGTLDKYIGDAIMAFWGAPVTDADHAAHGVNAALRMQAELERINREVIRPKGWPQIRIGIGLNSGVMRVGDMGSKIRRAYTVMGDPVNLGSRLEGLTREYGVGILVGEETRRRASGFVFREVDRVRVKGKDEPVAIFEPLGREGEVDKSHTEEMKLWHQCLKQYRAQDWDHAEMSLLNLTRMNPQAKLYKEFVERIAALRQAPPGPGWDGVTAFKTK
jgi:adenylate cyclase